MTGEPEDDPGAWIDVALAALLVLILVCAVVGVTRSCLHTP